MFSKQNSRMSFDMPLLRAATAHAGFSRFLANIPSPGQKRREDVGPRRAAPLRKADARPKTLFLFDDVAGQHHDDIAGFADKRITCDIISSAFVPLCR